VFLILTFLKLKKGQIWLFASATCDADFRGIYRVRQWIGRFGNGFSIFSLSDEGEWWSQVAWPWIAFSLKLSHAQRAFAVKSFYKKSDSYVAAQCEFRKKFGIHRNSKVPSAHAIKTWVDPCINNCSTTQGWLINCRFAPYSALMYHGHHHSFGDENKYNSFWRFSI